MNVTVESLREKHGADAEKVFDEIATVGGYGNGHAKYVGGLDILGALDPSNEGLDDAAKNRIAELSGVARKDVDTKIEDGRKALANGVKSKDFIIPPDMTKDIQRA